MTTANHGISFPQIAPFTNEMLPYTLTRSHKRMDNWSENIQSRPKDNRYLPRNAVSPSNLRVRSAVHPSSLHYRPQRPGTNLPNIVSPATRDANQAMARLERMFNL